MQNPRLGAWKAFVVTSVACFSVFASSLSVAAAADDTAVAAGSVRSLDGAPIASAVLTLTGNGRNVTATTDRKGTFLFPHLHSGTYTLNVYASGYNRLSSQTVEIAGGMKSTIDLSLPPLQVSSLTEIGSVTANGSRSVSTLPAPVVDIAMQPLAQRGVTSVADVLSDELSTTVVPVIGGGLNTPKVVSLRGPDPSETLVDIDGHQVNNGSTGDFDLSLLDPADLTSTEVVYGIAPSSLFGPDTLGGALNVRTLEPTAENHALERFTIGSYNTIGETLQATGRADRLGYAVSYHRVSSGGDQNMSPFPNTSNANGQSSGFSPIGDSLDATSTIEKMRYSLWNGAGFIGASVRDQAVYRDVSATLSSVTPGGGPNGTSLYSNYSGTSVQNHNTAYDFDFQAPIGQRNASGTFPTTAIFRHQTTVADQSVNGPGSGTTPYLYNDHDRIADDTLEIDHALPKGEISARYALTTEALTTDFTGAVYADSLYEAAIDPNYLSLQDTVSAANSGKAQEVLGQAERSLGLRYAISPTEHLHYTYAGYYSDYSTFGRSIDPRFGFVWNPKADTAYRISLGSTFQSPQLPTFVVDPVPPPPTAGYIQIGNPNASAERSTEYDIGADHRWKINAMNFHMGGDLYRTNLHNGVADYQGPGTCLTSPNPNTYHNPQVLACETYPVNVSQEVYQGVEIHGEVAFNQYDTIRLGYDIDSEFIKSAPSDAADGFIPGEQQLEILGGGVPLHKITLDYRHEGKKLGYYAGLLYEGSYNETGLGPFATVHAGTLLHLSDNFDLELAGTNLTNVYDFKQIEVGSGLTYATSTGPTPTNAIPLAPRTITLSISHKI